MFDTPVINVAIGLVFCFAVASVFGASFWFDLLGKLVRLRGAGRKPGESKTR